MLHPKRGPAAPPLEFGVEGPLTPKASGGPGAVLEVPPAATCGALEALAGVGCEGPSLPATHFHGLAVSSIEGPMRPVGTREALGKAAETKVLAWARDVVDHEWKNAHTYKRMTLAMALAAVFSGAALEAQEEPIPKEPRVVAGVVNASLEPGDHLLVKPHGNSILIQGDPTHGGVGLVLSKTAKGYSALVTQLGGPGVAARKDRVLEAHLGKVEVDLNRVKPGETLQLPAERVEVVIPEHPGLFDLSGAGTTMVIKPIQDGNRVEAYDVSVEIRPLTDSENQRAWKRRFPAFVLALVAMAGVPILLKAAKAALQEHKDATTDPADVVLEGEVLRVDRRPDWV